MNVATVLFTYHKIQVALYIIIALELTGYLFPPPAKLQDGDRFDYVIIGVGTAGSVLATRLVQQKYNVLVIEAGHDAPYESSMPGLVTYTQNSHVDWNYTSSPDGYNYQCHVDKLLDLSIGKMLGGSSGLNYMVYSRGNRVNFDEWAQITNDSNWKWDNILKYFIKVENVTDSAIRNSDLKKSFGSEGYIGVTRHQEAITGELLNGFQQIGKDIIVDIDGNRVGYSRGLVTLKGGFRQGAGTRYLSHITESRYIATAKGTLARKIIFDENKKAIGVQVTTDNGKNIVVKARKEIIISAGALKSPQLLMLSGIGPKKDLKKLNIKTISDLPVGKNLQDHVATFIPYKTNKNAEMEAKDPGKFPFGIFVGYASLNDSKSCDSLPRYNVIGYTIDNMKLLLQLCAAVLQFSEGICNKLYNEAENNQVMVSLLTNLYPFSRGEVLLRSTNPMDSPKVLLGGYSSDRDLENMVDYILDYVTVENSTAFKNLGITRIDLTKPRCDAFKKDSREYFRCYILCMMISLKNYSGTCAMGTVVDSRLRVQGVSGLRVVDASVIPSKVGGVLYNTVMMIGERAADIIIEDAREEYNSM